MPLARRFLTDALADLGANDEAIDTARLLVSEVSTNALLHARSAFLVTVAAVDASHVRVCVSDRSPVLPHRRAYGVDTSTGRGMRLLATLASSWAAVVPPDPSVPPSYAKSVWFEVPLHPATGSGDADAEDARLAAAFGVGGGDAADWLAQVPPL